MTHRWWALALSSALAVGGLLVGARVGAAGALAHPAVNIVETPNPWDSGACRSAARGPWSTSDRCTSVMLRAFDHARATEGLPALSLPGNWDALTAAEQFFVVVDLERLARGLPPYRGLNAQLDAAAQSAALLEVDPLAPAAFPLGTHGTGSVWGSGSVDALDAVYAFVYDDGWGGAGATVNVDCTSATAPGCWGHRDVLLGRDTGLSCSTCEMGAAVTVVGGVSSVAAIVASTRGRPPATVFTWSQEARFLATPWTPARGAARHPPTTLRLGGGSGRLAFTAQVATPSRLIVRWSVPGARNVSQVLVRIYRDAHCRALAHSAVVASSTARVRSSGRVVVDGAHWFAHATARSATLTVRGASGAVTSACRPLGRG